VVIECALNDLSFCVKFFRMPKKRLFFSYMCNYKAKGDIILHFGANKTIQGIIFINLKKKKNWVKKHIFWALNCTVVLI
jgi:hypothetical protein